MGLAFRYLQQQKYIKTQEQRLRKINQNLEKTVLQRTQELDKEVLEDISGRIKSLALIHEQLQNFSGLDNIDMKEYFSTLFAGIKIFIVTTL